MKKEDLIHELTSLLEFMNQSRDKICHEHDKFQVSLTNTLKLLDHDSSILTKMKGKTDDLKTYLIRESSEIRSASLDSYNQLRVRVERIRNLVEGS